MPVEETIRKIIYLKFISPETLLTLKIIFIGISLLLLFFIFLLIKRTTWLRWRHTQDMKEFIDFKSYGAKKYEKTWAKITRRLERHSESEYKLAIIEADGFLNEILEKMGYQGATLGERLNRVPDGVLPNMQDVREAYETRSNIVHDPNYKITPEESKKTIAIYEKALQDLEVL